MPNSNTQPRFTLQRSAAPVDAGDFAADVRSGLSSANKRLSCQYIYDAEGSQLFEEICRLPEYYPTRTEAAILADLAPELVSMMGAAPELVELGSGSAEKTQLLIAAFLAAHGQLTYRPIDISVDAIRGSSEALMEEFPGLQISAFAMEYQAALAAMGAEKGQHAARLVLWLGSSIGNFERQDGIDFLAQVRGEMGSEDRMLVGLDLRKDKHVLEAAYDDAQGVTAKFNKNILKRINTSLGGHFDLDDFRHEARYREDEGRVEMWLVSKRALAVRIDDLEMDLHFEAGEGIHTEYSHKYSQVEIEALAAGSGFSIQKQWFDEKQLFCNVLLQPVKR